MYSMIYNTRPWKTDLKRMVKDLLRRQSQTRWTPASYAGLERTVMLGCYSIRKLREAYTSSNRRPPAFNVKVTSFPSIDKSFCDIFWPEVNEHFDLTNPKPESVECSFICDQIIHSYVFVPWFNPSQHLAGLFVGSKRLVNGEKGAPRVLRISIDNIVSLFEHFTKTGHRWWGHFSREQDRIIM